MLKEKLTENIQHHFDRNGITEKAEVTIQEPQAGKLIVQIHTIELLQYSTLQAIEYIIWALAPIGLSYELLNIAKSPTNREQKLVPDGIEYKISMPPDAIEAVKTSAKREFINIDTSTDVTMLASNKKKK